MSSNVPVYEVADAVVAESGVKANETGTLEAPETRVTLTFEGA